MNLRRKVLVQTEKFIGHSTLLSNVLDVILSKIAPKTTASAYPCWYEYRYGGAHIHCLGAMCYYHQHRLWRQCCCQSPVCGAYGCGPWNDPGH